LGRRGPGTGLKQARTAFEAVQWLRLFDALSSPESAQVLPHLGLRSGDAAALREVCGRLAASLGDILAETREGDVIAQVNEALAVGYADLERGGGARLARATFALSADGFPGPAERGLVATWDQALRRLRDLGVEETGVPAAKRDIVVALLGHYFAAVEPLHTLAAEPSAGDERTTEPAWLVALARWRRFASVCRALAKVLTPAERQRIVVLAGESDHRHVRSVAVDCWSSSGSPGLGEAW
jgi:hypothetical protein